MQAIKTIGVRVPPSEELRKALTLSEKRLSEMEVKQFGLLLEQTAARYPNQETSEMTAAGYRFDMRRLAERYGLKMLQSVLADLRIRPGQKFFPAPDQVAEELEVLVTREQQQAILNNQRRRELEFEQTVVTCAVESLVDGSCKNIDDFFKSRKMWDTPTVRQKIEAALLIDGEAVDGDRRSQSSESKEP
jgi:hypothetical protein